MDPHHQLRQSSLADLKDVHCPDLPEFSARLTDLLKTTWLLNRTSNSDDFEEAQRLFQHYCGRWMRGDVTIHRFRPGETYNHWIVPRRHNVHKFILQGSNGTIYATEKDHPLVVAPFSCSVDAVLTLDNLKRHIVSRADIPDAFVYYARRMYQHWHEGWTLSLPHQLVESLPDGEYRVVIDSEVSDAPMPVFEYHLGGASTKTICLVAHICHPGQVNDSLAGAIALLQALEGIERDFARTSYSYRLLLVPELIGSVVYLSAHEDIAKDILFALSTNMTSHDGPIALAVSRSGDCLLDIALKEALRNRVADHCVASFYTFGDCGDELAFDTVGYRIPTPTLSRMGYRFPNYHTSRDTLDEFLREESLARHHELANVIHDGLWIMESNFAMSANFRGAPCLSNPDIDLYLQPSNINNQRIAGNEFLDIGGKPVDSRFFMQYFIDSLDIDGITPLEISASAGLPYGLVVDYARGFVEKGLVNAAMCERQIAVPKTSVITLHRKI